MMRREWIPSFAALACIVVGLELDHVPRQDGAGHVPSAPTTTAQMARGVACSWRPAAEGQPLGPALVMSVRADGDVVETLHQVSCADGWHGWVWAPDPRGPARAP